MRHRLASPSLLAATLVVLLVAAMAPQQALAAEPLTPEQVLDEESKRLRGVVMEADGFVERMEAWHGHAATLEEISATLQQWKPMLDDLEQLRMLGQLGLFDALAQADPSLRIIGPLFDGLQTGKVLIERLDALSRTLVVLGSDLETLLTQPSLSLEQLQALRGAIPQGIAAIEGAAKEYGELRPGIDMAFTELEGLEKELRAAMAGVLPMLGDDRMRQQLDTVMDAVFGGVREVKGGLDAMADHAPDDVATLRTLEAELREAEAHHAYAGAEQLLADDQVAAATDAFGLIVETWPGTRWGDKASERLAAGLTGDGLERGLAGTPGGAPGIAWMLAVLLATAASAAGWIVWTRRRERASRQSPPIA